MATEAVVQALVQAEEGLAVSPLRFLLVVGVTLLDTLGVTGSSPVAPIQVSVNIIRNYTTSARPG
jgi:hypothetical protein